MPLASPFSLRARGSKPDASQRSSSHRSPPDSLHLHDTPHSYDRPTPSSAESSLPLSIIPTETYGDNRRSGFMEDVLNAVQPTHNRTDSSDSPPNVTTPDSPSPTPVSKRELANKPATADVRADSTIGPVTIPTRTSSSHAVNGDSSVSPRSARRFKSAAQMSSKAKSRAAEGDDTKSSHHSSRHKSSISDPAKVSLMSSFPLPPNHGAKVGESPREDAGSGAGNDGASDLMNGEHYIWTSEKENILRGPFDYLESHPGKDIRSQLITAFNSWLQVPPASLTIITKVVGMLHTASLLIDDVEDSSVLRRGVPVAHAIFGTAQTINSANYVYFCGLQELLKLSNPDAIRIYTEELLNLHRGQGMDLFWRDTLTCPSEDDYLEMVGNKTGGLFRLAIKLMCAEAPSHNRASNSTTQRQQSDYVPLVNTVGLLFQILDDYKNLSDTSYTANKGLCEDLTEGKFSFPIIHAIRSDPSNLVLINILKQKTKDDEVKRYAVGYMERTGSFAYTRRVLRGLTKKALALVEEVDDGRGRGDGVTAILERLKVDKHSKTSSVALT